MRYGLAVPTATEGMMYPIPFASIDQAVQLAVAAEEMGFESIWGNDHVTTQRYVREEFPDPPRFYDPLAYLSYVAAKTQRLRLATCIVVLPFRHPVMLAKQVATLDLMSEGRVVLGVGIGAYREEFEAMFGGRRLNRGEYAGECLQALQLLFSDRRASYNGRWLAFEDVESFPKPLQSPLPILSGGNSPGSRRRAATLTQGWLPACLTPAELRAGLEDVQGHAEQAGRKLPDDFEVALQVAVSLGKTTEEAMNRFEQSQLHSHLRSLSRSTLKDQSGEDFAARNLIGTPDEVAERVESYSRAGVNTLAGLLFATNSVGQTLDAMAEFSEVIIGRLGGSDTTKEDDSAR